MRSTALPTLSEVRAFTRDYLMSATGFWSGSATRWIDTFDGLTRDVGARQAQSGWARAAESGGAAVGTDRRTVVPAADRLAALQRPHVEPPTTCTRRRRSCSAPCVLLGRPDSPLVEDFSLTSLESTTTSKALAAREALARNFGTAIRSDVLTLVQRIRARVRQHSVPDVAHRHTAAGRITAVHRRGSAMIRVRTEDRLWTHVGPSQRTHGSTFPA